MPQIAGIVTMPNIKRDFKPGIFCSLLLVGVSASPGAWSVEPNSVAVGDYDLLTTLDLSLERDDNIYFEDSNETSSSIVLVEPELVLRSENAGSTVQ